MEVYLGNELLLASNLDDEMPTIIFLSYRDEASELRIESNDWHDLQKFCRDNRRLSIRADPGSLVSLFEPSEPSLYVAISECDRTRRLTLCLSLTEIFLDEDDARRIVMRFVMDLPTTLGHVAETSNASQLGQGVSTSLRCPV